MKFKSKYPFQARLEESTRIIGLYPNRIPIICEKSMNIKNTDIPNIDKSKYLVEMDLTISQFLYVIRKRIKLSPEKAIFLFVGEIIPPSSAFVSEIYSYYRDVDGFLYITYSGENVFG